MVPAGRMEIVPNNHNYSLTAFAVMLVLYSKLSVLITGTSEKHFLWCFASDTAETK